MALTLDGTAGITANPGTVTVTSGTVTTSTPIQNDTQTWNASGVTFTGWKVNITDTASASGSLLADLQVGGSSKFSVRKDGAALASDGTVGSPGITFASDTDSGMYRIGTNNWALAAGGVNMLDMSSGKLLALNGYAKFSNTGSALNQNGPYHEMLHNANSLAVQITNTNTTMNSTVTGIGVYYSGAAPNSTVACFMYNEDTSGLRSSLRSNGGLANYSANNVNLSDERLKKDIVDAPSYYERWKQLQFRTFLYKNQTDSELNLGVIAQELETVCPELVSNDGFGETPPGETPLKTVYQTDFQYATAKALQELMLKFEELKAEFDAYKATHP